MVFFFFQAEDGIRDLTVTGVQTCALPIYFTRGSRGRRERLHELLKFGPRNLLPHNRRVSRLGGISTIHSGGPASGDTVGPGAGATSCDVSATATAASGAGRSGWKAMMLKGGKTNSAEEDWF